MSCNSIYITIPGITKYFVCAQDNIIAILTYTTSSFLSGIFRSIQESENIGYSRQQGAKSPGTVAWECIGSCSHSKLQETSCDRKSDLSKRWLYIWYRIFEGELEKGVEIVEIGKWGKIGVYCLYMLISTWTRKKKIKNETYKNLRKAYQDLERNQPGEWNLNRSLFLYKPQALDLDNTCIPSPNCCVNLPFF